MDINFNKHRISPIGELLQRDSEMRQKQMGLQNWKTKYYITYITFPEGIKRY